MLIQLLVLYLCIIKNENAMKKVKTFKELQKHPLVSHIDYEYQYGIFDETDYIYLLYLVDGKKFQCIDSGIINAPTKQKLVTYFNFYEII